MTLGGDRRRRHQPRFRMGGRGLRRPDRRLAERVPEVHGRGRRFRGHADHGLGYGPRLLAGGRRVLCGRRRRPGGGPPMGAVPGWGGVPVRGRRGQPRSSAGQVEGSGTQLVGGPAGRGPAGARAASRPGTELGRLGDPLGGHGRGRGQLWRQQHRLLESKRRRQGLGRSRRVRLPRHHLRGGVLRLVGAHVELGLGVPGRRHEDVSGRLLSVHGLRHRRRSLRLRHRLVAHRERSVGRHRRGGRPRPLRRRRHRRAA